MPQFPSRDLTNQYISLSYQDVAQKYSPAGTSSYLLDGLGNVIFSVPNTSFGNQILTTDQTASYAVQSVLSQVADVALIADTASIAANSISSSYALSASYAPLTQTVQASSSWASQSLSSSYSAFAINATSASYIIASDIDGVLPVNKGGTGVSFLSQSLIPYGNNDSPIQSSSHLSYFENSDYVALRIGDSVTKPKLIVSTLNVFNFPIWTLAFETTGSVSSAGAMGLNGLTNQMFFQNQLGGGFYFDGGVLTASAVLSDLIGTASFANDALTATSASYAPFTQTIQDSASWSSASLSASYSSIAGAAQAINFVPTVAVSASAASSSVSASYSLTSSWNNNSVSASYVSGSTSILGNLYLNTDPSFSSSALIVSQSLPFSQSRPVIDLMSTWSGSTSTVYTGLRCNIIDSGSSISSKLIDIQRNGSSVLSLTRNSDNWSVLAIGANSNAGGVISNYTTDAIVLRPQNGVVALPNAMSLYFGNTTSQNINLTCNTWLGRESNGNLAISTLFNGSGTNGSSSFANAGLRLYSFKSSSGAFERSAHYWSGSTYYIATEQSGSGRVRDITLQTSGSNRVFVSSSGNVGIGTITPIGPFVVNSGGADRFWVDSSGHTAIQTGRRFYFDGAVATCFAYVTSNILRIGVNSSETLFLNPSGLLSIGSGSQINKLDVRGNISCSVITASLFNGTANTASFVSDVNVYSAVSSSLWGSTITVDFNGTQNVIFPMSGSTAFSSSNRTTGQSKTVTYFIYGDTVDRAVSFESGWNWLVTTPTVITASKRSVLTLTCVGSNTNDVYAAYKESV